MERDILRFASDAIDEMSLRLDALLRGSIILIKNVTTGEDIVKFLTNVCAEMLCFASVRIREAEGSVLVMRGVLVAAYFKSLGRDVSGVEALDKIIEEAKTHGGEVVVYELQERDFEVKYADVVRRIKEHRATPPKPPHPRVSIENVFDIQVRLLSELKAQGLPLSYLHIEHKDGVIKLVVDWVGSTRYPIHVALAVIKELVERDLYFKRVELESRVKEHTSGRILETSRSYIETDEPALWRSLATILRTSSKLGFFIEKLDYKLKKDHLKLSIDIVVPLSKVVHLVPASYRNFSKDITKEVFKAVSEVWRGKIELKLTVSISTHQGYVEFEEKAP
ncbi:MAG: hypothetical protein QXZ37_06425 [Sulfolobales archaeon]